MRILLRWIVGIVFLAPSLSAQPWPVESTKISQAVQDITGQVWGITYNVGWGLYRWEGDTWKSVGVMGVPGDAGPFAVARGPDGAVYCVWSAGADTHAMTWHKGDSSKLVARFTGHLVNLPRIFVEAHGNAWITECGRHIFRVTPQGRAEGVYIIADNQFLENGRPENERSAFNPVYATVDARGRIWFWSDCLAGGTNIASLAGVLICDGERFEHHPHIVGVPDKKLSIVAPDDAEHMWLAVADDQLYRVDINTLTSTPVAEPSPRAFRYVQKIFQTNQETYLVAGSVWQAVPERSGNGRSGVLWRLRDGKWERLIAGLDMRPEYAQHPFRPFLATARGLWVGAFGSGPWFVPAGRGEPALIDWHYDYPLDGSEAMFQLADGRLLIVSANEGSIAVRPDDLLAAFESPPEVSTLNPPRTFIQDRRGHILGLLPWVNMALSDWDGKTWTEHALPGGFDPLRFFTFAEDSLNRIWLLPDAFGKVVAIFEPIHQAFEVYPGYADALQAQLPRRESFHLDGNLITVPSFSPDGRICYRDEWAQVRYFDGQKWLHWARKEIEGTNIPFLDGPAFFDRAGNVAVNIGRKTWEFTEAKGWHMTDFEPGLGTDRQRQVRHSPVPPAGCDIANPDSIAQDRLGTYWLTHRGQLYRAIPGLCRPQFSPREHQPFIDSREVRKVLIDLQGNAFLETYFHFNSNLGEYVIVKARPPGPKTIVHAIVSPLGGVKLQFEARSEGKLWFTWRVDGGPWAAPTDKPEAKLEWLPNGKHRIEAEAVDERLQTDPTPAETQVEIQIDPRQQISALIKQLQDPDYSVRNAAVAALLRQPAVALPLLRAAREKADTDQRWWIDAAIQQIEESLSSNKKP
jgi:streptogramin lyase